MVKTRAPREIGPDLLDRLRQRFEKFPLIRDWELSIDALAPGKARLSLVPGPSTTNNASGVVNGGVLATLADIASAVALSTSFDGRMPFATSDLHIRYLDPADSTVTAEAEVLRASLRSAILDCRMSCGGRVVAISTAHFTIKLPREAT